MLHKKTFSIRWATHHIALAATLFLTTAIGFAQETKTDNGFVTLIGPETKDLSQFEQKGGVATYELKDGVLIGTSVPKTPNSFLCTKKLYSDFELELEFKVDPLLNSGVQIRSECYDKKTEVMVKGKKRTFAAGRVHGYQVEIDPSARAWSAGIYDEARRGWLNDLKKNEKARKAFKQNEWNHYRIVCKGDSIKTWINGVQAADLTDDVTAKGFVALQVHGVGKDEKKVGKQVMWRNVKIKELK